MLIIGPADQNRKIAAQTFKHSLLDYLIRLLRELEKNESIIQWNKKLRKGWTININLAAQNNKWIRWAVKEKKPYWLRMDSKFPQYNSN